MALYAVVWNNPKIHPPEREKVWLACEAHRRWLADYLDVRGFLRRVERLSVLALAGSQVVARDVLPRTF